MRNAIPSATATEVRRAKPLRGNGAAIGEDEQAQRMLQAMLALRDGDLSQRLPAGWDGVFGKIAEVFNDIADLVGSREIPHAAHGEHCCDPIGNNAAGEASDEWPRCELTTHPWSHSHS